jgi:hypothetical protein
VRDCGLPASKHRCAELAAHSGLLRAGGSWSEPERPGRCPKCPGR